MKNRLFSSILCIITAVGMMTSGETAAFGQSNCGGQGRCGATAGDHIKVRFIGTGAADWNGPDERGEHRRWSSILVDDKVLVDFTPSDMDMLPEGFKAETIFYTHSHGDHYNPEAALKIGLKRVYCGSTWVSRCRGDFERTAARLGVQAPEVIGLEQQEEVTVDGVTFKALPANHCTGDLHEQALIYLMIKGDCRVLYATDTGGIPANAARGGQFGVDGLDRKLWKPLNGLIMEATMGMGEVENFRIFSHSCVDDVLHTVNVLKKTHCYEPAEGVHVYLTHLARTLHGTQAELDATLPEPLKAAYDGLEVVF